MEQVTLRLPAESVAELKKLARKLAFTHGRDVSYTDLIRLTVLHPFLVKRAADEAFPQETLDFDNLNFK